MGEKDDKGVSRRAVLTFWRRSLDQLRDDPEPAAVSAPAPAPLAAARPIQLRRGWPLRPPGTTSERHLLDHCMKCGACVAACPASAIAPLPASFGVAAGTPAIDPAHMPCVLCTGIQCTHVCPSGTLTPLTENAQVKMGLAVVDEETCITYHGQQCPSCFLACPVEKAIYRDEKDRIRVGDTCTGCGLCEHVCPVAPKAIRVVPAGFSP